MRPNIGRAVLGGLVGTLAITLMMYRVGPMMGLMRMDIAASLGQMTGTSPAVGMLLHFMNGTIIFPLIYAYLLYRVLPRGSTVKGLIWGAILWLLAQLIVMPMMGGGLFSSRMGGTMTAAGSLLGHLVYGGLLGAIAGGAKSSASMRTAAIRTA